MNAEELNKKIIRLQNLPYKISDKYTSLKLFTDWIMRCRKYQLSLINQFKNDICTKQKKNCADEWREAVHIEIFKDRDIYDSILNAPEPD